MDHLASQIAKKRRSRNLSLREVGAMAGLSYTQVYFAERGRAHIKTLIRLAKYLGVPERELLEAGLSDLRQLARSA